MGFGGSRRFAGRCLSTRFQPWVVTRQEARKDLSQYEGLGIVTSRVRSHHAYRFAIKSRFYQCLSTFPMDLIGFAQGLIS